MLIVVIAGIALVAIFAVVARIEMKDHKRTDNLNDIAKLAKRFIR